MISPAPVTSRQGTGIWWGLVAGTAVWVGHLIFQANQTFGSLFGDFLIPGLAVLVVGACLAALRSTDRRAWWLTFAGGVVLTVPVALVGLGILLVAISPM